MDAVSKIFYSEMDADAYLMNAVFIFARVNVVGNLIDAAVHF